MRLVEAFLPRASRAHRWLLACALVVCFGAAAANVARAQQEAGTAVYVRTDDDHTRVIAPRLRVATPVGDSSTRLDLVYTMDIWTSASVDIRASASKPITEQRDEIDVHLSHDLENFSLTGGYRYSKEPDYESHGGTLGISHDFADKSATLALDVNATFDTVGRAGDPGFARAARVLTARGSFTQIIDQASLVQLLYELGQAQGYLSSPYRFVAIGASAVNGFCTAPPPGSTPPALDYCIPETNPDERIRHAIAVRGRHAFGSQFSVGLGYRFYFDDWGLMSHTVMADFAFVPERDTTLALRYRFYTQNAAAHYEARYLSADYKFYTNDKELSPFTAHRVALDVEHAFALEDPNKQLRAVLSIAPSIYQYSNFLPLTQIKALEVTLATVFQL